MDWEGGTLHLLIRLFEKLWIAVSQKVFSCKEDTFFGSCPYTRMTAWLKDWRMEVKRVETRRDADPPSPGY
ncbi:hypothetical protein QOZ95_000623 [Paenibacillus brasilensis]|uniref:Uncharacterized protein n=1 Tax=Paenibacillus brasilensis TaxID=128574 RepID=A0ABU0KVQ9_9BACL|nr:hypothetical protein [Paenibacillus brasilensis]